MSGDLNLVRPITLLLAIARHVACLTEVFTSFSAIFHRFSRHSEVPNRD